MKADEPTDLAAARGCRAADAGSVAAASQAAAAADDPLWYRDAVIYELHVKASPTATVTASATCAV